MYQGNHLTNNQHFHNPYDDNHLTVFIDKIQLFLPTETWIKTGSAVTSMSWSVENTNFLDGSEAVL